MKKDKLYVLENLLFCPEEPEAARGLVKSGPWLCP